MKLRSRTSPHERAGQKLLIPTLTAIIILTSIFTVLMATAILSFLARILTATLTPMIIRINLFTQYDIHASFSRGGLEVLNLSVGGEGMVWRGRTSPQSLQTEQKQSGIKLAVLSKFPSFALNPKR